MDTNPTKDTRVKLHGVLQKKGLYTKSLEDFEQQFSDEGARGKLYIALSEKGLYTKAPEDFDSQFFGDLIKPTAQPLTEGFSGPSVELFEQQQQIIKEGKEKQRQEVEALAEQAGFRQLTDDAIQGWVEEATAQIASGDVDATAWQSGVEQFKSSLASALDQASSMDPTAILGGEASRAMMMSKEGRATIKRMRESAEQRRKLQSEGYFREGGLMEQAMKRQLLANEQFKGALKSRGLDPEATMQTAFEKGGFMDGLDYIWQRVQQQGPQLTGAIAAGAVGGAPTAGALMGASSGGGDILSKALTDKKIDDQARTAALAKGILEGTAESILSPVSAVGGQISKRIFSGAAKEVAKQGGKSGLKGGLRKVLSAGSKEGFEESFVETMSPFIDEAVKQLYEEDADFDLDKFLTENFGEKGRSQILESFVIGAATGMPVGGIQAITSAPGQTTKESDTEVEQEPEAIVTDKDIDFHAKNIFVEGRPVEDIDKEVTSYLETLTDEERSAIAGKEQALELAAEAYNERLKDEQATTQEEQVVADIETTETTEAAEEGGSQAGDTEVTEEAATLTEETQEGIAEQEIVQQEEPISETEQEGDVEQVEISEQEITQPGEEVITPEEESTLPPTKSTTNEEQESTQPEDVQEGEGERVLEGVRDEGDQTEGREASTELRTEEEGQVAEQQLPEPVTESPQTITRTFEQVRKESLSAEDSATNQRSGSVSIPFKQNTEPTVKPGVPKAHNNNVVRYRDTPSVSYEVDYNDPQSIAEVAKKVDPKRKTDLHAVPKIAAALKQFLPGTKIVIHQNKRAAQEYLLRKYGGQYNLNKVLGFYNPRDGSVHFLGGGRWEKQEIMRHEFLHPFVNAIMQGNPALFNNLFDQISALPEAAPVLGWARRNYSAREVKDETIVEFFAQVGSGAIEIKPSTKDKIIEYINEILEAVGLDYQIQSKDVDIKKFAASLAESMNTGREINNPFLKKENREGLNKMVLNDQTQKNPTLEKLQSIYDAMPETRQQQLAPVMDAAREAEQILTSGKGDLRAKVAAIPTENLDSLSFMERISRYKYMKKGHNSKEQAKAFMNAAATFFTDPARSGLKFMKMDTSDPDYRSLKGFIERKDKDSTVNDEDIIRAVMIAYGLNQDDAIDTFEDILHRRYVPPADAFDRMTARVHNATARRVLNFNIFGTKSNGDRITMRDFIDYARLNFLSDRYAPLRTARNQIEKATGTIIPEDMDAAAYTDTAQAKAVHYGNGILERFNGGQEKMGAKAKRTKSFVGRILAKGIKMQEVETFLFMQHVPEFMARKNDMIQQKRDALESEINDLKAELATATDAKTKRSLNSKINNREKKLASDRYQTKDALGTIERGGMNVPLTAKLATEIKNELEVKHPDLNNMANDYRQELLNEYHTTLREFQMIPDDRIDHLMNGTSDKSSVRWDFYVPMQVHEDVAQDPNELGISSVGSMSTEGLFTLGEGGFEYGFRDRKDPLKQLVTSVIAAREQAEANEGYRALARMLKAYGSKNWGIAKSRVIAEEDSSGAVKFREIMPEVGKENAISFVNEDGKKSYLMPKNTAAKESPLFMAMQRGDTAPAWLSSWKITKMRNSLQNYMRQMITSFNLVFGVAQMAPDYFDALFTTMAEQGKGLPGKAAVGLRFTNNYRKAVAHLFSGQMNTNSDAGVAWKEAQQNGMPMSWSNLNMGYKAPYEVLEERIRAIEQADSAQGLKKARIEAGKALDRFSNLLSDMNDAMENTARLAAYMTAKSYGLSPTQAAAYGKDVTVNFESKGRRDGVLRGNYLFYGAAVKGIARTARTAKLLGWKGAAMIIMGSALSRAYQYAMMDEEEMDDLVQNDYSRQNRIVLPIPGTDININMKSPYSILRIYNSMGKSAVDIMYNKRTEFDAFWDLMSNTLTVFDPIAGSSSLTSLAPTYLQPAVGIYANLDYKGDAIVHDMVLSNANRNADAYTKNTNPVYIAMADNLYNYGIDLAPGYLEYLMNGYVTLPAIKNIAGSADEMFKALGGKRASEEIAKEMGFNLPPELTESKVDYQRLFPTSKAFYRPTQKEKIDMWNLYAFNDRKMMRDLTRDQAEYIIKAYGTARKYKHSKKQLNAIMNNIIDRFPEHKMLWERKYPRVKEFWDIRLKAWEDREKLKEELNKRKND